MEIRPNEVCDIISLLTYLFLSLQLLLPIYCLRHLSLSVPALLLSLASPLKPTPIFIVLNISLFDSPGYIHDLLFIFTFNDVTLSSRSIIVQVSSVLSFLESTSRGESQY